MNRKEVLDFMEEIKEKGKKILYEQGNHSMIFFLISGHSVIPTVVECSDKDMIAKSIREAVKMSSASAVLQISEVWFVKIDKSKSKDKGLTEEDKNIIPSKSKNRIEALMISLCSRDGYNKIIQIPFKRTESNKIIFDNEMVIEGEGNIEGRFMNWWKE